MPTFRKDRPISKLPQHKPDTKSKKYKIPDFLQTNPKYPKYPLKSHSAHKIAMHSLGHSTKLTPKA
jgi:hypothetical protein